MFNGCSSPTVSNCTFNGNTANNGGGMANTIGCSPTVTNCSFSGNAAANNGGGMFNLAVNSSLAPPMRGRSSWADVAAGERCRNKNFG